MILIYLVGHSARFGLSLPTLGTLYNINERMVDFMTITLKANNENEMRFFEKGLKEQGFTKTSDCMWAKIYRKDNTEYVISREY